MVITEIKIFMIIYIILITKVFHQNLIKTNILFIDYLEMRTKDNKQISCQLFENWPKIFIYLYKYLSLS